MVNLVLTCNGNQCFRSVLPCPVFQLPADLHRSIAWCSNYHSTSQPASSIVLISGTSTVASAATAAARAGAGDVCAIRVYSKCISVGIFNVDGSSKLWTAAKAIICNTRAWFSR